MVTFAGNVWLITGASRGIGLELTKQLLQSSATVIATARDPAGASALNALAQGQQQLHVLPLDVTNPKSIHAAAEAADKIVGDRGIDYLVNNAGIIPGGVDTAYTASAENLRDTFETNVIGPALVSQAFLPLVQKSTKKTILHLSSALGCIGLGLQGSLFTSYAVSKSALNMLVSKQAKAQPDVMAVAFEPGWLRTDLGGPHAALEVSEGVTGVLNVVSTLTKESSGNMFDYKGEQLPW